MRCRVYIWETRIFKGEPGHCALDVEGVYISFWPGQGELEAPGGRGQKKRKKFRVLPSLADCPNTFSDSYEEDVEDCHGDADVALSIEGLCASSMLKSWHKSMTRPYNLKWFNCATVARLALDAGFDGSTFNSFGNVVYRAFNRVTTPFSWAGGLIGEMAGDTVAWTPALVHERALDIKRMVE